MFIYKKINKLKNFTEYNKFLNKQKKDILHKEKILNGKVYLKYCEKCNCEIFNRWFSVKFCYNCAK